MTDAIEFSGLRAQRRYLEKRFSSAIDCVLEHGQFILGPEVQALEAQLSDYTGMHVVTCGNGTDALMLALLASGVTPGSAVVVPSFTFCATAEAACLIGAVPVFADVDPTTALMTAATAERAVSACEKNGLRAKAIIPVELYGHPIDASEFEPLTSSIGAAIVIDAAQSFGARLDGRVALGRSATSTTSFFPSKPLGCFGDGGAIFTANDEEAEILRSLRVHGTGSSKFESLRIGMNSRLDTIQAAVLLTKLEALEQELTTRRCNAAQYFEMLADELEVIAPIDGADSAWAQYTITVAHRDRVRSQLAATGIPTGVYYASPLPHQPAYAHFPVAEDQTGCEALSERVLSLPMHGYLTDDQVERIARSVRDAIGV